RRHNGERLPGQHSQRPAVGGRTLRAALQHLGRTPANGRHARGGRVAIVGAHQLPPHAQVGDFGGGQRRERRLLDQDVARRQVAVDDAVRVQEACSCGKKQAKQQKTSKTKQKKKQKTSNTNKQTTNTQE